MGNILDYSGRFEDSCYPFPTIPTITSNTNQGGTAGIACILLGTISNIYDTFEKSIQMPPANTPIFPTLESTLLPIETHLVIPSVLLEPTQITPRITTVVPEAIETKLTKTSFVAQPTGYPSSNNHSATPRPPGYP